MYREWSRKIRFQWLMTGFTVARMPQSLRYSRKEGLLTLVPRYWRQQRRFTGAWKRARWVGKKSAKVRGQVHQSDEKGSRGTDTNRIHSQPNNLSTNFLRSTQSPPFALKRTHFPHQHRHHYPHHPHPNRNPTFSIPNPFTPTP
jgi:hypothetical protein